LIAPTLASVSIAWDASVVPDVTNYTVYRASTVTATQPAYSSFSAIGTTTGVSFRDTQVKPGFYWYTVVVTRRSVVTPTTGISSNMSVMSPPAQIKSPPPVATTKTSGGKTVRRFIPLNRLVLPQTGAALAGAPAV